MFAVMMFVHAVCIYKWECKLDLLEHIQNVCFVTKCNLFTCAALALMLVVLCKFGNVFSNILRELHNERKRQGVC
jgi:hypothetical protein